MSEETVEDRVRKILPQLPTTPEPSNVQERLAANGPAYTALAEALKGMSAAKAYDMAGLRALRGGTSPFRVWLASSMQMAVAYRASTLNKRSDTIYRTAMDGVGDEPPDLKLAATLVLAEQSRIAKQEELEAKQEFKRELVGESIDAKTEYLLACAAAIRGRTSSSRDVLHRITRPEIADTTITVETEAVPDEVDRILKGIEDAF